MALTKITGRGIGSVILSSDTASGDDANIGFTAAEGLILTGQGSTNDVTIKNDADANVIQVPTGTTNVTIGGNLSVGGDLDVTGNMDMSDANLTNVGTIALDSLSGDGDANTTIAFSGSDVITFTTGGTAAATLNASQLFTANAGVASTTGNFSGVVTANAGVVVDNITIDGTEIDLSSGDLLVDVAGDITLDAGGSEILLNVATTAMGHISMASSNITLKSLVSDKDLIFQGNDGGSAITALTLDMSAAGAATFNDKIIATELDISGNVDIDGTTNLDAVDIDGAVQIDAAVSVGVNDTGYDVKFFGATASAYMEWDASADDLILGGAGRVVVPDGQLVLGSTAVTSTAAELNLVDGITAGTVIASKAIITDSNIDITGGRNATFTGVITGLTLEATGDTAAGDNAAIGYTAAEGLILTGQGSTNDITIKNDADADVITIATGTTVVGIPGSLDIEGAIDVNGTTNLDVVDIDGAVNMATTALVTGVLTTTAATVFNGGFAANDGSTISTADNTDTLTLISTDADADVAPNLVLYRNSGSPADNDQLGKVKFTARNDNSQDVVYTEFVNQIKDASDGTEDGRFAINVMTAGTGIARLDILPAETVFNEGSYDVDFRVESNDATHAIFVDGGNNKVGILNTNPNALEGGFNDLVVGNTSGAHGITIRAQNNTTATLAFADDGSHYSGHIKFDHATDAMDFMVGDVEKLSLTAGATIFNEASADVDFRVESNGATYALFVDGGNNHVNVMTSSDLGRVFNVSGDAVIQKASSGATATSGSVLVVEDDDNAELSILGGSSSLLAINFGHSGDADDGMITYNTTSGSEAMNFLVEGGVDALYLSSGDAVVNNGSVDMNFRVESNGNDHMLFVDGGEDRVGIGSTPLSVFAVADDNSFSGADGQIVMSVTPSVAVNESAGMAFGTYNDVQYWKQGIFWKRTGNYGIGELHFASHPTADTTTVSISDSRMMIDAAGKVGIGDTAPDYTLHVNSAGTNVVAKFESTDSTAAILLLDNGGNVELSAVGNSFTVNPAGGASKLTVTNDGYVTMPSQPAFNAHGASAQNNIAVGSQVTVAFGTERFDQNADFASNTFTAPVTGKYQLNVTLYLNNIDSAAAYYELRIITSNDVYYIIFDPDFGQDAGYWYFHNSVLADMDASDTAYIGIFQSGGTAQTDLTINSFFSGYLAC